MSKPDPLAHKRIKLIKPHRHAGRDYLPEQCLELPEGKAQWLISVGAAEAAPAPAPAPAAAPVATPKTKEQ
ncbi:DUF7210 family protein [Simplicispira psychrophila]|uniref:DUF7210 family protein n=1 Tax=Simplicispira psychrophila TaxID=80882 RepID=UPI0004866C96|nr:hypothetical protein [Simplicispira psychrophila]